jgi:thymidylate kinase
LKGEKGYEFYKINGEQSIEDVHKDIISALKLS